MTHQLYQTRAETTLPSSSSKNNRKEWTGADFCALGRRAPVQKSLLIAASDDGIVVDVDALKGLFLTIFTNGMYTSAFIGLTVALMGLLIAWRTPDDPSKRGRLRWEGVMSLGKSFIALDRVTDYSKQADGSWHADLRNPTLHVEGESPNDCRYRLADQFDALLAGWLVESQKSQQPRPLGVANTEKDERGS